MTITSDLELLVCIWGCSITIISGFKYIYLLKNKADESYAREEAMFAGIIYGSIFTGITFAIHKFESYC
jgi:hypothetical protein